MFSDLITKRENKTNKQKTKRALGTEATGRGRCKLEKAREGQHVGVSGAEPDS